MGWKEDLTTAVVLDARVTALGLDSARPNRPDGSIQVVVNNAGITRDTLAMRMKQDQWQSVSCDVT